jgi:hypothetical protein
MNAKHLKLVKRSVMRPVAPAGRKANDAYRVREHLTGTEMTKLLKLIPQSPIFRPFAGFAIKPFQVFTPKLTDAA